MLWDKERFSASPLQNEGTVRLRLNPPQKQRFRMQEGILVIRSVKVHPLDGEIKDYHG